ncbi:MAG: YlbF family regulator [Eubacteriaceae bacterium]
MNISSIAKELANEMINTKEYHIMQTKKNKLFSNVQIGKSAKIYRSKQFKIINSDLSPDKKQKMMINLTKEHMKLLNSTEMKEYMRSIDDFQKQVFNLFSSLNKEINKIVNG